MTQASSRFDGLRVVSLESRRATEMQRLIERFGGVALVSPSMREVPLERNTEVVDFARRVIAGQVDIIILMTGVGTRHLLAAVEQQIDREQFLIALGGTTIVARGPKPVAVLRELNLKPDIRVPEPNTWRELLATLDEELPVAGARVALQEYGISNAKLIAGLEARGAQLERVVVYAWELPEDVGPLGENARRLAAGEVDVVMFTSSQQITYLLQVAERLGLSEEVWRGLGRAVIASIGPTTSDTLSELGLPADMEPSHPKMGHLVSEAAERAHELLERKRRVIQVLSVSPSPATVTTRTPAYDSIFMKACRREPVPRTPVWLMRQAGRYMAEYREVRAQTTFLELCKNPQLCAEVMLTAVNRLKVDAAIIFSDLLPILEPLGFELEFAKGEGPVIHNPVRESSDIDRTVELESVESLSYVMETVRLTREALPAELPLIGFAGAPFTLASYAIEGGSSRNYLHTKTLMYRDPGAWDALMSRLTRAIVRYLNAQIAAGADCIQLFDSWAGCLGPDDYRRYVFPYTQAVIRGLTPGVPVINFATGNPALLPLLAESGGDVIGIDWRIRLEDAWRMVGHDRAVQGNLDPVALLAEPAELKRRVQDVLKQAGGRPGHIFNLGHGVLQQTPVESAALVVELVHQLSEEALAETDRA